MNKELVDNLTILAKYHDKIGENFRAMAYKKAILAIKNMPKITDINQLKDVKNIGPKITLKIKEYLDTGEIRKVEEIKSTIKTSNRMDEKVNVTNMFKQIWGMDKKAETLWDQGIRSLEDLKKNQDILTRQQKIGLKYYYDLLKKIPRDYITTLQMLIRYALYTQFGKGSFKLKVAGSYRRKLQTSNDIDVLLMSNKFNLKQAVEVLIKHKIISDVLSLGNKKFMGIAHCPSGEMFFVRLDIEFIDNPDEWGSALLYFTGSKTLNITLRQKANELGLKLNQHGLFNLKTGKRLPCYTEEEIFEKLGYNYIKPDLR